MLQEHHHTEIISSDTVRVINVGYDENHKWLDHFVTIKDGYYSVKETFHNSLETLATWNENNIKEYLGY